MKRRERLSCCWTRSGVLGTRLGEHLRRFNSHIAKGLYAEIVGLNFVTFGEVTEYIDRERREYYRDGFDDGPEWIFYNDILFRREQTMYVDRLRSSDDQVTWTSPRMILGLALPVHAPHSAEWVASFWTAVPLTPDALRVIAGRWRPFVFDADTPRHAFVQLGRQTANDLAGAGLAANEAWARAILEEWAFPMHSLDLRNPRGR